MTRRGATVRELVEELAAQAEALDKVPAHRRDRISLQHHRRDVLRLARLLEKRTRPAPAPKPTLPRAGTVARVVLEVLEADARGHDHDHLRMLTGLTDAELAVRVTGAGPNSVRPRRVDLVRRGLVELTPGTGPECEDGTPSYWRTTSLAHALLLGADRG